MPVSHQTVGRLLKALGYALHVNAKQLEARSQPSRPRRPVRLHRRAAAGVPGGRAADHQRRHQEEGADRQLQERRAGLGPGGRGGQRPRLPRRRARAGGPLRHLRPDGQPGHGLRRARRPTRRPFAVAAIARWWAGDGPGGLSAGRPAADPGRRRRQQRLPAAAVEAAAAGAALRPAGADGDGLPLPDGLLEVEPDRAPAVRPDQPELGGPAAADLGDAAGLPPGHDDDDRAAGRGGAAGRATTRPA